MDKALSNVVWFLYEIGPKIKNNIDFWRYGKNTHEILQK